MQFRTQVRRSAWALVTFGLIASACDRNTEPSAPMVSATRPTIALEITGSRAKSGERVAVAVIADSLVSVGAVQGYLRFDPSRMRYRGQVRDTAGTEIMMVNDGLAAQGSLRLAVLDGEGIRRSGTLVFDVIGGDYSSSISFQAEEVLANGSPVTRVQPLVSNVLRVNSAMTADDDAHRMTVSDWQMVVGTMSRHHVAANPGEIRNGLKFGDTNFDGALTLADALYMINISLGLNEMIVGSDGTGPLGDRDAAVAGNVFPFNAPGIGEAGDATPPGLETDGSRAASLGDGLAIINESIGIDQPVVGEVIPGRPLTPVGNRIVVSASITTNTTWTSDNIYELQGGISVTNGATLTIQPGTLIEGQRGSGPGVGGAALFITRNGKIIADGTPLQPIVMTCVGTPTARFKGCWGGLTVLGNASLNDGALTSPVIAGRAATGGCREKSAEGSAGLYGGCNDDDNSGIIRYVRVEYAGFRFTPENELNGLALNGVGRGTIVDYVQVHAGLDDGIEMFGGTVNLKHLVLTANSDDSFDYTEGWNGKTQFVIVQHDSLDSDKGFEQDNFGTAVDALPRATPTIYNVTMVGKANPASTSGVANNNSVGGFNIRVGTRPHMFNFLVQNFSFALDVDDVSTCVDFNTPTGFELKNSIFAANLRLDASDGSDPAGCLGSEENTINAPGTNNQVLATSPLISPLDVMVPDWRPAFGTAGGAATPPSDGFFDVTATYIGAVPPANPTKSNIPWYAGWTRGWQSTITP